jgi:hypothetical protein
MFASRVNYQSLAFAAALAFVGCSSNSGLNGTTSGNGGDPGTNVGVGGGSAQSGGSPSKGGSTSSVSAGGTVAAGGVATGGTSSVTGGTSAAGGSTVATGGSNPKGGATAAGGSIPIGGKSATGGGPANGGAAVGGANGGTTGGGGPSVGGKSGGGATATGGSGGNGGKAGNAGGPGKGGATTGGATGTGGGNGTAGGSGKYHMFLLLGQSNMAGYPKAQDSDKVKNSRIQVLGFDDCAATGRKTDQWDVAVPPLHECSPGALGPGDWFSKTIIDSLPTGDRIGLLPCAFSGEKIETMVKSGGSHYPRILARAKLGQQAGGVIEGMLFHQGESNCGDSGWPAKVKQMATDLKGDLGLGDVPFLVGEMSSASNCKNHNPLVAQAAGLITNGIVVEAADLTIDPADTQWNVHFDHTSQVTLGKRYAAHMKTALGW